MKLPNTYNQSNQSGFSLIEIMVGMGILVFLMGFGLIMSMDFYRTYAFHSDEQIVVSILQMARTRALSNINQSSHGVHFDSAGHELVIFEGSTYDASNPTNENIPLSERLGVTWPSDVVFAQNSGNTTAQTVSIVDGPKTLTITVNEHGSINY